MNPVDWIILVLYILAIIYMGFYVGKSQQSQEDYYVGGRSIPSWQVALSIVATQVSAISLIGAPAFIALKPGGGLKWLQYEFAIPLAMMLIMLTVVPMYHRTGVISIYEYLEKRFGRATRTILSLIFMASRGLAAGVALLATSIVTSVCLDLSLQPTVLLIGVIAIVYTTMGGIRADIYSDILQLVILWSGALVCLIVLLGLIGDQPLREMTLPTERYEVFRWSGSGLGDGETFGFWPMLVGGFFLYLSYYGCDQSETQRLLTTKGSREAQKALFYNGLLRFPLVITYCSLGIFLIPFLESNPGFLERLGGKSPDFLLPYFLLDYMPHGLLGLLIAGILAASMSSLDSTLNSLSAVTWRDYLQGYFTRFKKIPQEKEVWFSKVLTVTWGMLCTFFALGMIGGPETVLVLVNKIGSAFYGPILATFWLGILTKRACQAGAIAGLVSGVATNVIIWQVFGEALSWLWWNPIGFITSFVIGYGTSLAFPETRTESPGRIPRDSGRPGLPGIYYFVLLCVFGGILLVCWLIERMLT
jgi:SSS family solute:Na+ symporter